MLIPSINQTNSAVLLIDNQTNLGVQVSKYFHFFIYCIQLSRWWRWLACTRWSNSFMNLSALTVCYLFRCVGFSGSYVRKYVPPTFFMEIFWNCIARFFQTFRQLSIGRRHRWWTGGNGTGIRVLSSPRWSEEPSADIPAIRGGWSSCVATGVRLYWGGSLTRGSGSSGRVFRDSLVRENVCKEKSPICFEFTLPFRSLPRLLKHFWCRGKRSASFSQHQVLLGGCMRNSLALDIIFS